MLPTGAAWPQHCLLGTSTGEGRAELQLRAVDGWAPGMGLCCWSHRSAQKSRASAWNICDQNAGTESEIVIAGLRKRRTPTQHLVPGTGTEAKLAAAISHCSDLVPGPAGSHGAEAKPFPLKNDSKASRTAPFPAKHRLFYFHSGVSAVTPSCPQGHLPCCCQHTAQLLFPQLPAAWLGFPAPAVKMTALALLQP